MTTAVKHTDATSSILPQLYFLKQCLDLLIISAKSQITYYRKGGLKLKQLELAHLNTNQIILNKAMTKFYCPQKSFHNPFNNLPY